ncbi:hypothetical protein GLAREA_03067 [Glarea lozoyensis ATCC 20868]|uniref:Uncharacterized protein n=1 Tax=Glarea lozoyensis (strain ATCC 20868 / MF5171) TaxID=1116229 RepID=S3DKR3_GLAL2|nr:uncharacterized protein GLAREA_03067 [Glarea lozoyensis ATCC 20868]EPE27153.1 hypothetical protein GLAREA_03067 [Glarea lozoyensis ATCC 20868]
MNWQYTQRPDRAFANLNLAACPIPTPPLPPYIARKLLEEMQRPDRDVEYARLPPSTKFRCRKPKPARTKSQLKGVRQAVGNNAAKGWVNVVLWSRGCCDLIAWILGVMIISTTRWAHDISERFDLRAILAVFSISCFLRLASSSLEVDAGGSIGNGVSKPIYVLMVPL